MGKILLKIKNKTMINQQQKEILESFASIKKEINILDNKAEDLKVQVLEIMQSNELGEVEVGNDKISIGSRRSWSYSEVVKDLEKTFKDKQKEEQQLGTATYKENFYPIFSDSDNKKDKEY